MPALRAKSERLTGYLEFLIKEINKSVERYHLLTPSAPPARGCQLSIFTASKGKRLFDYLAENGVMSDWREDHLHGEPAAPGEAGVIRVAPVPLYNSFQDVFEFAELLRKYH